MAENKYNKQPHVSAAFSPYDIIVPTNEQGGSSNSPYDFGPTVSRGHGDLHAPSHQVEPKAS